MGIFERMAVGVFLPKKVVGFLPQISGHKRVDRINSYSGLAEEESLALGKTLKSAQWQKHNRWHWLVTILAYVLTFCCKDGDINIRA